MTERCRFLLIKYYYQKKRNFWKGYRQQWQLIEYTSDSITWKLVGKTGLATTSLVGVNDETAKADWNDLTAHFFIGVSNNVQIFEYDGTRYNVWTRSPATAVNIGDTFTINLGIAAPTGTRLPPAPLIARF